MEPPRCFHVFMLDELFPPADRDNDEEHPNLKQQEMSEVWNNLPEELVRGILLWLPASSQTRFRLVCKAWLSILSAQDFKDQSAAIAFSSGRHICGIVHSDTLAYVPPAMTDLEVPYKVHKVSLAGLPQDLCKRPNDADYSGRTLMYESGLILLGNVDRTTEHAGQRFCERRFRPGERCVAVKACVVNPLTGAWKQLPTLHVGAEAVPCMCLSAVSAAGFEVSVVKKGTWQVFWVYSSSTDAWSRPEALCSGGGGEDEFEALVRRHVSEGAAARERRRLPPFKRAKNYHRHVVNGEVLLIPELPNRCEVWGVHHSRRCWVLLSVLPREMQNRLTFWDMEECDEEIWLDSDEGLGKARDYDLDPCVHVYVSCTQRIGDVIFLTLEAEFQKQVVAYHVVERSWQIILCHHPPIGCHPEDWFHCRGQKAWQRTLIEAEESGAGLEFFELRPGIVDVV